MKVLRTLCLISLGGLLASWVGVHEGRVWPVLFVFCGLGWAWTALGAGVKAGWQRLLYALAGKPMPMPETDPKALAAEIKTLNAQLAQLRDTATSFDMSFDQTLHRLNERLSRLEQQSAYVQAGRQS
jgi:hypothetical protein